MLFIEKEKAKIEKKIELFFNKKTKNVKILPDCISQGIEEIKKFTLNGGKRLRAILAILAYKGYSGKDNKIYDIAIIPELIHSFLLIHDDIIDNDDTRRNAPTCHISLNKLQKGIGKELAIILGDLAYTYSMQILNEMDINANKKRKLMDLVLKTSEKTCYGEYLDICSQIKDVDENFVELIHLYKTSYYTFDSPFKFGAIFAGIKKAEIKKLEELSIYLGLMFQLQDDMLGIFGNMKKFGKPIGSDIVEGKKTLLTVKSNSKYIKNKLGKKITQAELNKIRRIMKDSGSVDYCNNLIEEFYKRSKNIMNTLEINEQYKDIMFELLDKLKNRKH